MLLLLLTLVAQGQPALRAPVSPPPVREGENPTAPAAARPDAPVAQPPSTPAAESAAQPAAQSATPPASPRAAQPASPAAADSWTAQFDEAWKRRDTDGGMRELKQLLKHALVDDPHSFDANWRQAALLNWEASGLDGDAKAKLGKAAWGFGDIAVLAKPDDVHGHYQAGTGIGLYSEGVGILSALSEGLEGKFRSRLQAALRINKDYLDGAPQVVWGRYFYKLPWPKRDIDESIRVLSAAVKSHPHNLRARLYLADSLAENGKGDEAKKLDQAILEAPLGEDPPEDKQVKAQAKKWLSQH
jgi:hypothetical protein